MEIGEPSAGPSRAGAQGKQKTGSVKVKVVDAHRGDPIEGATVAILSKRASTDARGEATVSRLAPGRQWMAVRKAWPSEDHLNFVTHYPKATIDRKAESTGEALVEVAADQTVTVEVPLEVYRPLVKVILYRNQIHPRGGDKYGHWWTVIDDMSSYGWWPKYPVGDEPDSKLPSSKAPEEPRPLPQGASVAERIQHMVDRVAFKAYRAARNVYSFGRTLAGVEGDLNGAVSFGGWLRRLGDPADKDPHHRSRDQGEERYQPVLHDGRNDADLKQAMCAFALDYQGEWSWRFELGNHCHTFQKRMMERCGLRKFKDV